MARYYDSKGKTYNLPGSPLAKGGEGSIFEVPGRPDLVAKVYHPGMDGSEIANRRAKIEAMVKGSKPSSDEVAWPQFALYRDARCSDFAGFAMKRISSGKSVNSLYAYPGPNISMRDKVSLAKSIARLTQSVHSAGHVIGDYNDSNLLIVASGSVALVDCDSLDIRSGSSHYPCIVCMPGYNAPEVLRAVKGSNYESMARKGMKVFTRESDYWALAVHLFRILMNGCHPYHCASLPDLKGSYPAPVKLDVRIERGETPFFKSVSNVKIPPFAPDVSALPGYLTDLFEGAFIEGHRDPQKRPDAARWIAALDLYEKELAPCHSNLAHFYWKGARSCPYCAADFRAQSGKAALASKKTAFPSSQAAKAPATGSPFAATAPTPAGNRIGKPVYWSLSIAAAVLIALMVSGLPPIAGLFSTCFGMSNPVVLRLIVFVGSLAPAIAYGYITQNDTYRGVGLSSASAAGGAVAAVPVAALLWMILQIIFVGIVVVIVLAGLFEMAMEL